MQQDRKKTKHIRFRNLMSSRCPECTAPLYTVAEEGFVICGNYCGFTMPLRRFRYLVDGMNSRRGTWA